MDPRDIGPRDRSLARRLTVVRTPRVRAASATIPKSMSLTSIDLLIITLSGLRSLCAMPARCIISTPPMILRKKYCETGSSSRPCLTTSYSSKPPTSGYTTASYGNDAGAFSTLFSPTSLSSLYLVCPQAIGATIRSLSACVPCPDNTLFKQSISRTIYCLQRSSFSVLLHVITLIATSLPLYIALNT